MYPLKSFLPKENIPTEKEQWVIHVPFYVKSATERLWVKWSFHFPFLLFKFNWLLHFNMFPSRVRRHILKVWIAQNKYVFFFYNLWISISAIASNIWVEHIPCKKRAYILSGSNFLKHHSHCAVSLPLLTGSVSETIKNLELVPLSKVWYIRNPFITKR